ncbi:MAG TPA: hypothetical protein VJA00_02390 [Candidatus Omnitrophota bacterium]|nr:hypothetical protein [Candidatus Omnitrophota bacterium]
MSHDGMDSDIRKLLNLLKKILRNHPHGSEEVAKFLDQKSFNLNLCFLTFVPMSPEDLADFEDLYEEWAARSEERLDSLSPYGDAKVEFKLNSDDVDFLRKHGIKF